MFGLLGVFVLACRPSEVRALGDPWVLRPFLCHRLKCLMIISFSANTRAGVLPRPPLISQCTSKIQVASSPRGCSPWTWIQKTWVLVPVPPFANWVLWQAAKWVLAPTSVKGRHNQCPWWGRSVITAVQCWWTVKLFMKFNGHGYSYYSQTHTVLGIENNFIAFIT